MNAIEKTKHSRIWGIIGTIMYILLFLVCMSPYSLFRTITGTQSETTRTIFWDARMQSMCLFLGVGLSALALRIIWKRHYDPNSERIRPLSDLEVQEIKRRNTWYRFYIPATFVLTGKRAVRYGFTMLVFGILLLFFSLKFWLGTFLPEVRNAIMSK